MNKFFSPKVASLVLQTPVNKGFFAVMEAFDKAVITVSELVVVDLPEPLIFPVGASLLAKASGQTH
ncbi:hypothetical protein HU718_018310 [Pseudomonas tensinigenes]|uniref:Uncharacterized protein n=1 Tax=Pseudomonas tensinigenes TaxID=2745511 RepID=A0ABX8PS95_9PSED|nr:hypothetical protein [Pseudomonas tensinigenes]QXI03986.1 hypothetical protein HU718_018310 [Pseudomonas tensinigenes]